jgi:transcriptional regulator of met regulon
LAELKPNIGFATKANLSVNYFVFTFQGVKSPVPVEEQLMKEQESVRDRGLFELEPNFGFATNANLSVNYFVSTFQGDATVLQNLLSLLLAVR